MALSQQAISEAAHFLADRCLKGVQNQGLPDNLRPQTLADALAIQANRTSTLDQSIGAWKCLLPKDDELVIAPIFEPTVCIAEKANTVDGVPICPILLDHNRCRIEPELAFKLTDDVDITKAPFSRATLEGKVSAHMALELMLDRNDREEVGFFEKLADCLLNQGVFIGPELDLQNALSAKRLDIQVKRKGEETAYKGVHPNEDPFAPIVWLVNYLADQGVTLPAGTYAITGSYAGIIEVPLETPIELVYEGLGDMPVRFSQRISQKG